jgi:hypothetical protein
MRDSISDFDNVSQFIERGNEFSRFILSALCNKTINPNLEY